MLWLVAAFYGLLTWLPLLFYSFLWRCLRINLGERKSNIYLIYKIVEIKQISYSGYTLYLNFYFTYLMKNRLSFDPVWCLWYSFIREKINVILLSTFKLKFSYSYSILYRILYRYKCVLYDMKIYGNELLIWSFKHRRDIFSALHLNSQPSHGVL